MKVKTGKAGKRIISIALTVSMIAGMAVTVHAGDTLPYLGDSAKGANQPYQHGYRAEDLLSWSPQTDPYAGLLRAQIPLQNRNAAFAATQANPSLDSKTEYFTLAGDYGNAFFDSYPYTNEFSQYAFNYWQYADYYGSWHGMPTEEVPESLYDAQGERDGTSDWQKRYFEFGMMNLPNPGYTNAAHKNGVLSLGCIFQPRAYQHYDVLLKKDENGTFPYAQKLIEMCKYYGFDGWFFNMEGRSISAENKELLGDFFTQMRNAGLYIQWYTASSSFTENTAGFLTTAKAGDTTGAKSRANSVFLDYGWSTGSLKNSASTAAAFGLDALKAVFGGIEAGRDRWGNNFDRFVSDGKMVASIASLGTDFVHAGLDEDLGGGMRREQDAYQWMAFDRERMWWTGPTEDPTAANTAGVSRKDIGVNSTKFKGVAQYIAERSVISGDTFVTNFNTGHGLEYAVDGNISNAHEWSNIGMQDILPTWQWWFEQKGKLSADFDYGSQYKKNLKDGTGSDFDFDLVGAYNGGSSLAVYGKVDAENFMHLYKTDLDVKAGSTMNITFKKTSDDTAAMQLGLIFKDAPQTVVKADIPNTAAKSNGWVTSAVDLSAYAGKQIAAFGLVFNGTAEKYQMNIGQIKYTSKAVQKPDAPTGLKIEKAFDTGEMIISWEKADYSDVKQYNVYAVENDKEIFLGGTYDDTFYIKNVYDITDAVNIELKAVSADGTESEPVGIAHDYSKAVKDIKVTAEDGKLHVTWTGGTADVAVKKAYSTDTAVYTAGGDGLATVTVPTGKDADGARYTMTITKDGVAAAYSGRLNDCYSAPYDGRMAGHQFTNPLSKDWWKLHYEYTTADGQSNSGEYKRGTGSGTSNDWADFNSLPDDISTLKVTLEDYSGNLSEPVNYTFKEGEPIDLNKEIGVDEIPDPALLKAVKEQAGTTIGAVQKYKGALDVSNTQVADLTGIKLLSALTGLDISGTKVANMKPLSSLTGLQALKAANLQITEIGEGMLPASLVSIDLSNNFKLTAVNQNVISKMAGLKELKISGCTELQKLYLTGTSLQQIDISDNTKLTHFYGNYSSLEKIIYQDASAYTGIYCFDIRGSKFDLSAGTPERKLLDAMEVYLKEHPVTPVAGDLANLALNKNVTASFKPNYGSPSSLVNGKSDSYSDVCAFSEQGGSVTVDLGSEQTIESWKFLTDSYSHFIDYTLEYASDNKNYTPVVSVKDNAKAGSSGDGVYQDTFAAPVQGQYFRFTAVKLDAEVYGSQTYVNAVYASELELYGHPIEPYGLKYADQRPAAYHVIPGTITVLQNSADLRMRDYLNKGYADSTTVRGSKFADLAGASWIAKDYDVNAQIAVPEGVQIIITDSDGKPYADTEILSAARTGLYKVVFKKDQTILASMDVSIVADKKALNDLAEACNKLNESDYTPVSWAVFASSLNDAKVVLGNTYASQQEVDDQKTALQKAKDGLVVKPDTKALAEAIDKANAIDKSLYTAESVKRMADALDAAQKVLSNPSAAQAQVDKAVYDLAAAVNGLVKPSEPDEDQVKAQAAADKIAALPNATAVTKQNADAISEAYKAYCGLTQKQQGLVGGELTDKLRRNVEALRRITQVNNDLNASIAPVDGTYLDPAAELHIAVVPVTGTDLDSYNQRIGLAAENGRLVALFDIKLLKNGDAVSLNGQKVRVKIKLTSDMLNTYSDFKAAYISGTGEVTMLPTIVEDGYITFETTHFSNYAIIGTAKDNVSSEPGSETPISSSSGENGNSAQTGDSAMPLAAVMLLFALSGAVLTVCKKHRRS